MAIKFILTSCFKSPRRWYRILMHYSYFYWFFLVYENRYYLQVYLDNYAYRIGSKQMTGYLDENAFED